MCGSSLKFFCRVCGRVEIGRAGGETSIGSDRMALPLRSPGVTVRGVEGGEGFRRVSAAGLGGNGAGLGFRELWLCCSKQRFAGMSLSASFRPRSQRTRSVGARVAVGTSSITLALSSYRTSKSVVPLWPCDRKLFASPARDCKLCRSVVIVCRRGHKTADILRVSRFGGYWNPLARKTTQWLNFGRKPSSVRFEVSSQGGNRWDLQDCTPNASGHKDRAATGRISENERWQGHLIIVARTLALCSATICVAWIVGADGVHAANDGTAVLPLAVDKASAFKGTVWPKFLQVLAVLKGFHQGLLLSALLGLSAFFSMAEASFMTLWPWKVRPVAWLPVILYPVGRVVTALSEEVGASEVVGDREKLRVPKGRLQHSTYTPEQTISEPPRAVHTPEFTPDIAEQSICLRVDSIEMTSGFQLKRQGIIEDEFAPAMKAESLLLLKEIAAEEPNLSRVDSIEMKTGFQLKGQGIIEDEFAPVMKAEPLLLLNEIAAEELNLSFERNREDEQPMNMMVTVAKTSRDPWHDDTRGFGLDIDANEDFHRETSVIQDIITPSPSGRWTDYDNDSAPYVKAFRRGVYNYSGGKGRATANPSVDFWGNNVPSGGRAERGTLTRINATGRGSLGSVDDVDNELPEKRRGGRKDEQMSRGQVRRRDSAGGPGQRSTSGKQYVQNERDLWDNESLSDEPESSGRSVRPSPDDQERERDLDYRDASDGDREWFYVGRGSQNRKILEEGGDYRNGRGRDGRYYSQERTRSYNAQDDRRLSEEEEDVFPEREVRDMEEEYFVNEGNSWIQDASQNGGDLGGNNSQMRTSSSSSDPSSSRNKRQIVQGNEEGDLYKRDARTLEEEEQVHGSGRRSWAESQNSDRDELSGSDYDSELEIRTGIPPYVQNEIEPEERNLPVRQPSRLQLEKFDRLLDEGEALLEEGMQGLEGRIEVGVAERMLYEAASLFDAAAQVDPSSLIAVGFLGNTLLVHGELKLKLSQQLRSMLPSSDAYPMTKARAGWDDERESIELTLQSVCEECEELLVDAGRKYRMALSLDRTDMRALYNWGLALCYRGQLIADEGGERAIQDADKVYLAAIDKFEAMLGMSQEYAPGALYNWGLAMRDRARLRPMGNRDRVKLLLQAKELLQDAVRLDPNNGQARGGVTAVLAELQELKRFEEMQNEQGINGRSSRSWWQ